MTRSNPTPLAPLDENLNRTLRLLAREWELAEARRRIEERGQPQVGHEVEEVVVEEEFESEEEEGSEAEMAENQNAPDGDDEPRTMDYYMAQRAVDIRSTNLHPLVVANNFEIKRDLVTMI
ncbi:unnamed protein product [Linum trigynum]|uniref:Uncharacterized protein n=1 Tax=Linum trigynum TaxID=586398 RepID=A0AAV2FQM6_9ROSI